MNMNNPYYYISNKKYSGLWEYFINGTYSKNIHSTVYSGTPIEFKIENLVDGTTKYIGSIVALFSDTATFNKFGYYLDYTASYSSDVIQMDKRNDLGLNRRISPISPLFTDPSFRGGWGRRSSAISSICSSF